MFVLKLYAVSYNGELRRLVSEREPYIVSIENPTCQALLFQLVTSYINLSADQKIIILCSIGRKSGTRKTGRELVDFFHPDCLHVECEIKAYSCIIVQVPQILVFARS